MSLLGQGIKVIAQGPLIAPAAPEFWFIVSLNWVLKPGAL